MPRAERPVSIHGDARGPSHQTEPMPEDPVDSVARLLARLNVEGEVRRTIVSELRRQWGGEQVYIRATDRASIDDTIRQGLEAGEKPEAIARKAGVSSRTVRRRASTWF